MAQSNAAKTEVDGKRYDKLIKRIVRSVRGIGETRRVIGALLHELVRDMGATIEAVIAEVEERLSPDTPEKLGVKLTKTEATRLIAEHELLLKNGGAFVHGNNAVTPEDLDLLGLSSNERSMLVTALDAGLARKPNGIPVGAAASVVRRVKESGRSGSEQSIASLMEKVKTKARYANVERGSEADLRRKLEEAKADLAKAQATVTRRRAAVKDAETALAVFLAEQAEDDGKTDEPVTPKAPAKTKGKGRTTPRARKGERIEAATA